MATQGFQPAWPGKLTLYVFCESFIVAMSPPRILEVLGRQWARMERAGWQHRHYDIEPQDSQMTPRFHRMI